MSIEPGQNYQEKKRQKQIFGVFLVIVILALAFGTYQFFHRLSSPFKIPETTGSEKQVVTPSEELTALQDLKLRDIDEDGLSDYDELYVYKTSPYIDDSDSDGIKDKAEIDKGEDPNCPAGQDCTQPRVAAATNQAVDESAGSEQLLLTPENIPVDTLRQALRDAGVSETALNSIDDETLRQMYGQVIAEEGISTNIAINSTPSIIGNISTNTNAATNSVASETSLSAADIEDLKNLNPSQIRELLIQAGIDKNTLDQMDDQTLQAIFQEALAEQGL